MDIATVAAILAASAPVSSAYWQATPTGPHACTAPTYQLMTKAELLAVRHVEGQKDIDAVADASPERCVVRVAWNAMQSALHICGVRVHEDGHLHEVRFSNPTDPAHSPDETNVMSTSAPYPVECARQFPPYSVKFKRKRGWRCSITNAIPADAWECKRRHKHRRTEVSLVGLT